MDCKSVKNWLLQAERLQPKSWPSEIQAHIKACAACVKVTNSLNQLERTWRELPIAEEAEQAKDRFLKKLPEIKASPKHGRVGWRPIRWAAVAAMVLIGISAFAWMLISPGETQASSDVVERLLDWNLDLTNADAKDRQRLLADNEPRLREDLRKAKLSADERELGEKLLDDGRWLATQDDPVAEADRIEDLAEALLERSEKAGKAGNEKDSERSVKRYNKVCERGVNPLFEKIAKLKIPEKKGGFEKELNRQQTQQKQLEKMLKGVSERARPELQRALDSLRKKGKGGPWHGHKK